MNGLISAISNLTISNVILESGFRSFIISFDSQLLISVAIQMISVLLLFYLLGRLLFNPVRDLLNKRKEKIASEYTFIKTEKEKTESLRLDYEEKITNINKEADQILAKARKKALMREQEIVQEAKEEADRIVARANLEIEREKEKAKDEIKKEIVEVATIMASKFVASSIDPATRNSLLEETLNEMGENTWLN